MRGFFLTLLIILGYVAAFYGGWSAKSPTDRVQIETLTVRDTIRDTVPIEKTRYVVRIDSIPYALTVTERERDTVYVPAPVERAEFRTESYFAIVEGYKPTLAYIETYNKTTYVTYDKIVKDKPRWGFGVQAGLGYNGKVTPCISIGVQYNLITW